MKRPQEASGAMQKICMHLRMYLHTNTVNQEMFCFYF